MRRSLRFGMPAISLAIAVSAQAHLAPLDEDRYAPLLKRHTVKVMLVDIWAAWCEPCREEMPGLVKLARRYAPQGLKLTTVSLDGPEELDYAENFWRKQDMPAPRQYKSAKKQATFLNAVEPRWAGSLPASFLYSRDGNLVKNSMGSMPAEALETAIRGLLRRTAR